MGPLGPEAARGCGSGQGRPEALHAALSHALARWKLTLLYVPLSMRWCVAKLAKRLQLPVFRPLFEQSVLYLHALNVLKLHTLVLTLQSLQGKDVDGAGGSPNSDDASAEKKQKKPLPHWPKVKTLTQSPRTKRL